jgi:hypothetical protein
MSVHTAYNTVQNAHEQKAMEAIQLRRQLDDAEFRQGYMLPEMQQVFPDNEQL